MHRCPVCSGSRINPITVDETPCPRCLGHGEIDKSPCASCGELYPIDQEGILFWDDKEKVFKWRCSNCPPPKNWEATTYELMKNIEVLQDALIMHESKVISVLSVYEELTSVVLSVLSDEERKILRKKHQIT